ncbi:MAG: MraZ protein [Alphaproteobacteria bacterium]|nr:MraZ protein [Alphaproteobacteria bacterium]
MQGFLSYSLHRVDKKGRVSVPSSYRAYLMSKEMNSFVCFPSLLGPWLQAVTPKQMQAFMGRQNPLAAFGGEVEAYPTLICSQAAEMIPDTDGRIVLPPEFLAHASIDEDIAFVGQGSYFSLWSPPLFEAEKIKLRDRALAGRSEWAAAVPAGHADATKMRSDAGHD